MQPFLKNCFVPYILCWFGGKFKDSNKHVKKHDILIKNRDNIWSNSWQKCRHFFRPSLERHFSAHGLPQGAPKRPYSFFFVVFSDFGPGSGLKSFGKIMTFSWFGRSLFSHQLRHRFFIDFWRNWDLETNILRYMFNGFAYTFHRNSARRLGHCISFCSR